MHGTDGSGELTVFGACPERHLGISRAKTTSVMGPWQKRVLGRCHFRIVACQQKGCQSFMNSCRETTWCWPTPMPVNNTQSLSRWRERPGSGKRRRVVSMKTSMSTCRAFLSHL